LPLLLNLPFLKIYTQGIFIVLAFFWGSFFLWKNILLTSFKEEDVFDAIFASIFGALFISRVVYVALHFEDFGFNILKFLLINGYPGLSLIGGVIGGFITLYIYLIPKKIEFSKLVDYMISPIMLALGIGKIGAFFAGTEIGAKTKFLVSFKYPNLDGLRHLTSFYEACLFFIGTYIAYKLLLEVRRGKQEKGVALVFFSWFFSFMMVVFDPIKTRHHAFFGYSFNMIFGAIMLLTATIYVVYYFRAAIKNKIAPVKR
jgi:phosphatidylglycerol---prolipoprotein diacylglyceryl transferase